MSCAILMKHYKQAAEKRATYIGVSFQILRDAQLLNAELAYINSHILPDARPWPDGESNPWRDDNCLLYEKPKDRSRAENSGKIKYME